MSQSASSQLGKYQLVARLATGGMAEIYLARQAAAGAFSRLVVVKRILPNLAEEPRFVAMFLEEARLASQIKHANVVQIYDVDHQGSDYYIAMEYIDGLSLGALCRRARKSGNSLPFTVSAEMIAQACDGLHAAHELCDEAGNLLGLVHRDVSPHNLMIDKRGVVKLVDFGIAKAKTTAIRTRTGDIKGKFPYMSPEQVRSETLDRRADIFSLGAIFAELVLGRRFFERPSELDTLKAITEEPIPSMHELDPSVPLRLSDVIARALQRSPEDRFQSAEEMGTVLRRVIEYLGERTSVRTVANYLESECHDLLEARARTIREVGQVKDLPIASVPRVEGFDESASNDEKPAERENGTRRLKQKKSKSGPRGEEVEDRPSAKAGKRVWPSWIVIAAIVVFVAATGIGMVLSLYEPSGLSGPVLHYSHPPTYPTQFIKQGFDPFIRYLEQELQQPVEMVVTKDYETMGKKLISGEIDFANLSPLLFLQTQKIDSRVTAMVSHSYEGAHTYQSYLLTQTNSGIYTLNDLKGKRFCYVDRSSTSGYLLPRFYLRKHGFDPNTFFSSSRISGTHAKVMQDIVAGHCDAGAVYSGAFANSSGLGIATPNLRLMLVAGSAPWDVVTASPKLSPVQVSRIKKAFLDFRPQQHLGRKILHKFFRIDGYREPHLEEYAPLEQAARDEGLL